MKVYFVECREEKKEDYCRKVRRYFPICYLKNEMAECTDIICIGAVSEEKQEALKSCGKELHYLDENLLPIGFEEKAETFLGKGQKNL